MKKITVLTLILVLVISLFAGCSQGKTPMSATGGAGESGTLGANGSSAEKEVKTSLVIGVSSEFSNIVPMSNNVSVANTDGLVVFALYDPLLWWNSAEGKLEPHLATEWNISDDGLEYTLKLREDVKFHNGYALTAEDVAFTYNLMDENPAVKSSQYPTFSHAEVIDTYTVKLVLDSPFAAFVNSLAAYHIGILSKDYFEEVGGWEAYQNAPVGSGPYQFVSRTVGSNIVMTANDSYWGGAPAIKDVTIKIISDANSQLISLENGEIDILINGNLSNLMLMNANNGITWEAVDSDKTCMLMMNMCSEVIYSDENLRLAIAHAIDCDGINMVINGGYSKRAYGSGRPGITARPMDEELNAPYPYDTAAAKDYLSKSNYKGQEIRVICQAGSSNETIAKAIQGNLQEVGINFQVLAIDGGSFFSKYNSGQDYECAITSFMPSLYDERALCQGMKSSATLFMNSVYPEGIQEWLLKCSEDADASTDVTFRTETYKQVINYTNEHAINVPLYYVPETIAYCEGLENVHPISSLNYRISDWSWAQ